METTNRRIKWTYVPDKDQLIAEVDGRLAGGFAGQSANNKFIELLETGVDINIGGNYMSFAKKQKIRILRAIWIKLGCDEYRADIISQYGVTSTADLSEEQLDKLIAAYNPDKATKQDVSFEIRNARSVAIKLLMELGYYDNNNDWTRVNAFMMDSRIAGKLLFQMSLEEVRSLHKKLRSIQDKELKKRIEIRRCINNN